MDGIHETVLEGKEPFFTVLDSTATTSSTHDVYDTERHCLVLVPG